MTLSNLITLISVFVYCYLSRTKFILVQIYRADPGVAWSISGTAKPDLPAHLDDTWEAQPDYSPLLFQPVRQA